MAYWLVKSEPGTYSFDDLKKDGQTRWDSVRNFRARNNLRAMREGDLVFFYHSNEGKDIVGIAKVIKAAYADPTAEEGDWSAVDLAFVKELTAPVTLDAVKFNSSLNNMELVRQSRLSVQQVTPAEFNEVLRMSSTKI